MLVKELPLNIISQLVNATLATDNISKPSHVEKDG